MGGAAAGGAVGAVSAANISAFAGLIGASQQRSFARHEAQKQRDWAERLSSTAYQRSMADMRMAGLNPILAYGPQGKGGAAATPSGAVARPPSKHGLEGVGTSAMVALQMADQMNTSKRQRRLMHETGAKHVSETDYFNQLEKESSARTKAVEFDNERRANQAAIEKTKEGRRLRVIERYKDAINPFGGSGILGPLRGK